MSKKTQKPNILWLYNKEEQRYADHVAKALKNSGGNPISIDYYRDIDLGVIDKKHTADFCQKHQKILQENMPLIISNEHTRNEILKLIRAEANKELKEELKAYIKKNKISGIFFPGDGFNYDTYPYHPEPKSRPRYSAVLLEIAKEENLPLIGACGGLQAAMHAEDVALKRVNKMVSAADAKRHVLSETHTNRDNTDFLAENTREQKVIKGTKLYNKLKKIEEKFDIENEGVPFFLNPEAHGGAIDLAEENLHKLHNKGYKISARSPDGIIQGVEHKDYNITLFQGHPEALAAKKHGVSVELFREFLIKPAQEIHNKIYKNQSTKQNLDKSSDQLLQTINSAQNSKSRGARR